VHRFHHLVENRIEDPARLFGITVGEELHGTLEVGEQHGHLLALAFERGLGHQDPLGEVLGDVGFGSGEAGPRGLVERGRALAAELVLGRVAHPARRADGGKRSRALAAESCSRGILGLAPETLHV